MRRSSPDFTTEYVFYFSSQVQGAAAKSSEIRMRERQVGVMRVKAFSIGVMRLKAFSFARGWTMTRVTVGAGCS